METELSRKCHGRECPSSIKDCAEQQHNESIVEYTDTGSPDDNIGNVWTSKYEIN